MVERLVWSYLLRGGVFDVRALKGKYTWSQVELHISRPVFLSIQKPMKAGVVRVAGQRLPRRSASVAPSSTAVVTNASHKKSKRKERRL